MSLIKLKTLKGETVIYEEQIRLLGITGHSITMIRKTYLHIILTDGKIKPVYVIKDNVPIDYDGIIGIDFIHKSKLLRDYNTKQIQIEKTSFKLYPYKC